MRFAHSFAKKNMRRVFRFTMVLKLYTAIFSGNCATFSNPRPTPNLFSTQRYVSFPWPAKHFKERHWITEESYKTAHIASSPLLPIPFPLPLPSLYLPSPTPFPNSLTSPFKSMPISPWIVMINYIFSVILHFSWSYSKMRWLSRSYTGPIYLESPRPIMARQMSPMRGLPSTT